MSESSCWISQFRMKQFWNLNQFKCEDILVLQSANCATVSKAPKIKPHSQSYVAYESSTAL